jgi:hypothetical protein
MTTNGSLGGSPTNAANRELIQDIAATREDHGALVHLFHEVAIRLLGAAQRVDLIAGGALDDQRVDLALPDRAHHLFGLGEAQPKRVGLFVIVGVVRDHDYS